MLHSECIILSLLNLSFHQKCIYICIYIYMYIYIHLYPPWYPDVKSPRNSQSPWFCHNDSMVKRWKFHEFYQHGKSNRSTIFRQVNSLKNTHKKILQKPCHHFRKRNLSLRFEWLCSSVAPRTSGRPPHQDQGEPGRGTAHKRKGAEIVGFFQHEFNINDTNL